MTEESLRRRIEIACYGFVIIMLVIASTILIRKYFWTAPPSVISVPLAGSTLLIEHDWSRSDKTLLLVLSETCRFCDESAAFYQRLLTQFSDRRKIQFLAIFPQDVVRAKKHLADLRVAVEEVVQSPLPPLKVGATPTLILVDNSGKVLASWVGKLSPSGEADLIERISL